MTENELVSTRAAADASEPGGAVLLQPYVDVLWSYRAIIAIATVGTALVLGLFFVVLSFYLPTERAGVVQFRLLFDGAAQNHYPNGLAFSPTEIVSTPVLTQVFDTNALAEYGTYQQFRDSVVVLQSNPAIEMLTYEYQAKLADTRLMAVDRARIEEEFKRKREALTDPMYSLSIRRRERLAAMPRSLMEKALNDILATWAQQADERKGATRYNVPVLSLSILDRESILREDYLIATDILRTKASRIGTTAERLSRLPGAHVIRTSGDKVSLAEVQANLQDIVRFKLEPLIGLIQSAGATKNARELTQYASNQLFQMTLQEQEAKNRVKALQASLRDYLDRPEESAAPSASPGASPPTAGPAFMPQVDTSFLDRVLALSTASQDQAYRERLTDRIIEQTGEAVAMERETGYYRELAALLRAMRPGEVDPATMAAIKSRTAETVEAITKAIAQIQEIHTKLSALNLNPTTMLYSVTGPFVLTTQRALPLRTAAVFVLVGTIAMLLLAPTACLVHHGVRGRTPRARR